MSDPGLPVADLPLVDSVEDGDLFYADRGGVDVAVPGSAIKRTPMEAIIYVSELGDDAADGRSWETALATFPAAAALIGLGNLGHVELGTGTIPLGPGMSLNGYAFSFTGQGDSTVLTVTEPQVGPALDFEGYVNPEEGYNAVRRIGGFRVRGDGTAGATKKGIRFDDALSVAGLHLFDIDASNTGGAAWDLGKMEGCTGDNLVANTPINAKVDDIPYVHATGDCNGNVFNHFRVRSVLGSADVGVSGAIVVEDNGVVPSVRNTWNEPFFENLHPPTDGCLMRVNGGASQMIHDPQLFDCVKEVGATNTKAFVFAPPSDGVGDYGGNMLTGEIPGREGLDYGVEISQDRNVVIGPKGYNGHNIHLLDGVENCVLIAYSSFTIVDPSWVDDDSGNSTNTILDYNEPRTWTSITPSGSWTVAPGGVVECRRDPAHMFVQVRADVIAPASASGTTAFVLPVGFRPTQPITGVAVVDVAPGSSFLQVGVSAAGAVVVYGAIATGDQISVVLTIPLG